MTWGQAPGVIHSVDPRVTGKIMPGDYVRILTPNPGDDGIIRIQVFPHDGRAVGNSDNKVWIDWKGVIGWSEATRMDRRMFTCEE